MKIPCPYRTNGDRFASVMDIKRYDEAKRLIGETFESEFGRLRLEGCRTVQQGRVERCLLDLILIREV